MSGTIPHFNYRNAIQEDGRLHLKERFFLRLGSLLLIGFSLFMLWVTWMFFQGKSFEAGGPIMALSQYDWRWWLWVFLWFLMIAVGFFAFANHRVFTIDRKEEIVFLGRRLAFNQQIHFENIEKVWVSSTLAGSYNRLLWAVAIHTGKQEISIDTFYNLEDAKKFAKLIARYLSKPVESEENSESADT
ncbi:MAG: hypothetical protein JSV08_05520 [Acidobacteriota bacterium]|nr:MAG: hypothetical protein JSV08_05520 [Acidobacteriota bacterium]